MTELPTSCRVGTSTFKNFSIPAPFHASERRPAFPIDPTSLSQSKMRAAATIVSEATQHQPTNTRGQSEERDAHSVTQGAVGSALPNSTSSSALPLDHERRVPLDSPPLTPLEDASGDDIFDLSPVNGGVAPSGRLDFISILPPEVICHIMLLVSPLDLSLCGCVSRSWRVFARSNIVWREMCRRRWSDKQFHPLELNPLVDWSNYFPQLTLDEILRILDRRGVTVTPGYPSSASWPSSVFPVSLFSWSWSADQTSSKLAPVRRQTRASSLTPQTNAMSSSFPPGSAGSQLFAPPSPVSETDDDCPALSERDLPWLKRVLASTLPIHAPKQVPPTCGKWMASFIAAELDSRRTRLTRSELTSITWIGFTLERPVEQGEARFHSDGTWKSELWSHAEWWRTRRDGRPQVNFYPPLDTSRRSDWGFELSNSLCRFVSAPMSPPPKSLGLTNFTDF